MEVGAAGERLMGEKGDLYNTLNQEFFLEKLKIEKTKGEREFRF